MSFRAGLVTGILASAAVVAVAAGGWWIATHRSNPAKPPASPPAAIVATPAKEAQFNTVVLSEDAERRLGVTTAPVDDKPHPQARLYAGEVTIPAGRTLIVAAPLGGTLRAPTGGVPLPGRDVKKGEHVFELLPLLTPEARTSLAASRVDADSLVRTAQTQLDAAKEVLTRTKQLVKGGAGPEKDVDLAQEKYDTALIAVEAAKARRDLFVKAVGDFEKGTAAPLSLDAPVAGLLRNVSAQAEQTVHTGAALFEITDLSQVWVRVPVYVADLPTLEETAEALVGGLTDRFGATALPAPAVADRLGVTARPARPAPAPPSANATAGTVDLFYMLENRDKLRPGQKVGVSLRLRGEPTRLAMPASAIVLDINGGTWVYVKTAPHTYARRRVTVRHIDGDRAVLDAGPPAGTPVVAEGAAELFGAEVKFGK